MFTKTTIALAIIIGAASGALADSKRHSIAPSQDVYDARGNYAGSDPDAHVRLNLRRDTERGQY
jgi:hypothetical protein